ncbi:unnamed protein product [Bemisia tabaci]|uniref:GATOR2 complex protein WDR24 n=1 Tax=Bemisia tabaci TaxID=7038 RepID=A0A9P0A9R6_BEMTA|nr:unnamed protein product [Bemisia tabaci]
MTAKTMFVTQEGPANALALNKDNSQVVIAGRNVFKVFSIEENEFVESCNLRVGKNLNLNFSCNDVAWNTLEDNILATAATNGAVVVWNLNRPSRSKQDHVFSDHKRTVNKVNFHAIEPSWLISGSQDGTMKCFDLRVKEAIRTFYSNTESVRDVQFCPHSTPIFAAVSENGSVQQWDLRKPERHVFQFSAHSGPVFACDWHPEHSWLATASRDKTIKVWDLSTAKPSLEHIINTIASVGRIKWRPQRKYHIASCALVVDCSINVWDIRRPYVPFASFDQHKDVATGIAWRGDPQIFLSTSRDCTLYHHNFKDATRPADKANPQGISFNTQGDIVYSWRVNTSTNKSSKLPGLLRRNAATSDDFVNANSSLSYFKKSNLGLKGDNAFLLCAQRYLLTGRPLADLCDHNAAVAKDLGKTNVSIVWSIIKTLYTTKVGDFGQQTPSREDAQSATMSTGHIDRDKKDEAGDIEKKVNKTPNNEKDDYENEEDEKLKLAEDPAVSFGDFFFGDSEMDPLSIDFERVGNIGLTGGLVTTTDRIDIQQPDWTLPTEAFALRHELQDRSPPPEQFPNSDSPDLNDEATALGVEDQPSSLLCVSWCLRLPHWDPSNVVVAALKHHASQGDIQTSASVLLALGEKRRSLINNAELDESTQEQWLLAYIDMLTRFKLWDVATQVIQLSWIMSVCQLNQQSTTVHTSCGQCDKPLIRSGWLCDRCHTANSAICALCHRVVKGLYAWCQGCSHGGHMEHIQKWLETNKVCPTGCGHLCEYT